MTMQPARELKVNPETGTVLSRDELEELANRTIPDYHDVTGEVAGYLLDYLKLEDLKDGDLTKRAGRVVASLRASLTAMRAAVPEDAACLRSLLGHDLASDYTRLGRLAFVIWSRGIAWAPADEDQDEEAPGGGD
jgi:hypothetical protein